jgi:hypothetical protein
MTGSEVSKGVDVSGALVHGNIEPNSLTVIPTIDPVTGAYRATADISADDTADDTEEEETSNDS